MLEFVVLFSSLGVVSKLDSGPHSYTPCFVKVLVSTPDFQIQDGFQYGIGGVLVIGVSLEYYIIGVFLHISLIFSHPSTLTQSPPSVQLFSKAHRIKHASIQVIFT